LRDTKNAAVEGGTPTIVIRKAPPWKAALPWGDEVSFGMAPIQSWTVAPPPTAALYVYDLFLGLRRDRFTVAGLPG